MQTQNTEHRASPIPVKHYLTQSDEKKGQAKAANVKTKTQNKSWDKDESGRVNPKKFLLALSDYYGKKLTENYQVIDEKGQLNRVWQASIEQFSNNIAGRVMTAIIEDKTKFTTFAPNPGELRRLFMLECDKLIGAPRADKYVSGVYKSQTSYTIERGEMKLASCKYSDRMRKKYEYLDLHYPNWREEAQKISDTQGNYAYAKYMCDLLGQRNIITKLGRKK